ncbi:MAG TPA: UDP-2,3-diacylglucosamine diphosphatase [Burkholderiales bacterium]|nr:UDP-2,3-diacylglucosamine diphosphatase [Burkholderiales bacterium]
MHLFISDLHLSADRAEANERFIDFIEGKARGAKALYVLGDLFESWIGDDDIAERFNAVVAGFFAALARSGTPLYVMHGNRDFLIGERFCRETGAKLLADPTVADIGGVPTLLMHGDTLCIDDVDYQAWRTKARDPGFQRMFLAKSLAERRTMGALLREKSKEAIAGKPAEIMDVNAGAVREAFRKHGVARLIHGHTHRAGRHELEIDGRRCERFVLPDWYGRGGYLEISGGKPRLVSFPA